MRGSRWLRTLVFGLGGMAALSGCVLSGQGGPYRAARTDIPLVPVPPPPLAPGAGTTAATASGAARPAPATAANPTPPSAPPPTPVPPPAGSTPRQLYQAALERYATIDSYIVRLTRRELVKDRMNPEEVMLFRFRKEPWSVYLKWLGKEGQGREVVYVKGKHEGKIHTLLAGGDIPFVPAGRRMALPPDSILVRSACRHPITQAGIGASIDRLGQVLSALERGDRKLGSLNVVGPVERGEFEKPVLGVEHIMPPGYDPSLPKGGRRTYFFHPESNLPMLVTTRDDRNQEVEYYRYDRLQPGVKLDDADFDPERLWSKPAGR